MYKFVGRAGELARLRARLDDARGGHGQVVLLAGEPGIGKTRLAAELGRQAEDAGMRLAWGRASEGEGCPPYWIFRELVRSMGLPVPDLLAGRTASLSVAEARFEAFEAVAEDVRAAAEPDGLLAVLDDLQWADPESLALLLHVVRGSGRSRLVILATYRDTETTGRAALVATLSTLAQESNLTHLRLTGLTTAEVGQQLGSATGTSVPVEVADLVRRRSGGNPFFVGELGRLLDADSLPDVVVDAVRARLARLSPSCRELVATAAALGDVLDPAALAEVSGRPVADVLRDLDEAAVAGIVTDAAGWRFGHDLLREAARLDLATATRLAAHARLAAHLASRADASTRAAEIAHHWLGSLPIGDPALATDWAERAADEAVDQLAWERAAILYQRAHDTGAPLTASRRSRLLRGAGVAYIRGGDVNLGIAAITAAADAAREVGDAVALGEVALAAEGLFDPWGPFRGGHFAEEALAALPAGDDPLRARLLALQAGEVSFFGGAEPDRRSAEALAMAERLEDGRALRSALRARQMVRASPDGVRERLELGNRMLALGTADSDDDTALWGRLWRFDALLMLGRLDGAEAELAPMRILAERGRRPIARWHYLRNRSTIDAARGRFDDAIAAARESLALVEDNTQAHASLLGLPLTMLILLGSLTGRADLTSESTLEVFDRGAPDYVRVVLASYLLREGDTAGAYNRYAGAPHPDEMPGTLVLSAGAAFIELAAEFGPPEYLAAAAAALRPYPDLFVAGGAGTVMVMGSVRPYLGIAAAASGRLDEAVRELRLGIEANDRADTPPFAALARFELAKVLTRRRRPGDVEEAAALAAAVAATAERLGMAPLHRDAESLGAMLRDDSPGPLTRREHEVAGHVAEGLTNKQIAALLHISERTVESHVQRVLIKLDLPNRTRIAAWVRGEIRSDRP